MGREASTPAATASGIDAAITAAGGMEAFQSALGVARRTVFLWKQQGIPAERVPAIEAATGVPRQALRPDLWPSTPASVAAMGDPLREGRANLYALLGNLLAAPPEAGLLARLATLRADETPIGQALGALGEAATDSSTEAVAREYHDLFVGLGRGELLPFASYYLTGFLHERPLAELRGELERLGIGRAPGVHEPEDHIGFVCETMAGLLRGGAPELAEGFFARHVRPWAPRCFADLCMAAGASFYRPVGALGRALMDVELAAAEMPA